MHIWSYISQFCFFIKILYLPVWFVCTPALITRIAALLSQAFKTLKSDLSSSPQPPPVLSSHPSPTASQHCSPSPSPPEHPALLDNSRSHSRTLSQTSAPSSRPVPADSDTLTSTALPSPYFPPSVSDPDIQARAVVPAVLPALPPRIPRGHRRVMSMSEMPFPKSGRERRISDPQIPPNYPSVPLIPPIPCHARNLSGVSDVGSHISVTPAPTANYTAPLFSLLVHLEPEAEEAPGLPSEAMPNDADSKSDDSDINDVAVANPPTLAAALQEATLTPAENRVSLTLPYTAKPPLSPGYQTPRDEEPYSPPELPGSLHITPPSTPRIDGPATPSKRGSPPRYFGVNSTKIAFSSFS